MEQLSEEEIIDIIAFEYDPQAFRDERWEERRTRAREKAQNALKVLKEKRHSVRLLELGPDYPEAIPII